MSFYTTVTEAESKVVDAVRDLREPIVDYVRKGVARADDRLPQINYPDGLPRPVELLESQYDFVKSLVAAQYDIVRSVVEVVSPLVGAPAPTPATEPTTPTTATKAKATKAAA